MTKNIDFGGTLGDIRKLKSNIKSCVSNKGVEYDMVASRVSDLIKSNVFIVQRDGRIIGRHLMAGGNCEFLYDSLKSNLFPDKVVKRINACHAVEIANDNVSLFDGSSSDMHLIYVPIIGGVENMFGTIVLMRIGNDFTLRDVLIAEYLSPLVGIEILGEINRSIEADIQSRNAVQKIMQILSHSEQEAVRYVIAELNGSKGIIIGSKIADKIGITRSVIANALRKLESAGVIESRSLGMKGTYVEILSQTFVEELGEPASIRVA